MDYIAKDFIMIRIPLLSEEFLDFVLKESVNNENKFMELVENNVFMEAIQIASPDLYHMIVESKKNNQNTIINKKIINSLCKYAVRASSRTTPFGLFCGFCMGTFGDNTSLILSDHTDTLTKRARADAEWIDNIVVKLEKSKKFMRKINVYKNTVSYKKGYRLINPYLCNENIKKNDAIDISSSIRYSEQVEQVLELCKSGIEFGDLETEMCKLYSGTDHTVIETFLWGLLENGFIISELRMPKANINAIKYLSEIIKRTSLEEELLTDLLEIQKLIEAYCRTCVGDGIYLFDKLQGKMKGVVENSNYLQVDMKMQMNNAQISFKIKNECENIANKLAKLSGYIDGNYNINEYKKEFLEKYSTYIEVPLLELLDPELGLGAPAGYIYPASNRISNVKNLNNSAKAANDLRHYLINKITYSACSTTKNIEFTDKDVVFVDEDIDYMDHILEKYKSNVLPDSFEMNFLIFASDEKEIEKGNYKIGIGPNVGSDRAGRIWGRFADMLSTDERVKYDELYYGLRDCLDENYQLIEIQEEPLSSRVGNIILNCNCSEYQTTIGCKGNEEKQNLELCDIVVGVDTNTNDFYLKSKSLNKKVKFITFNMLNTLVESNLCRFVREISSNRDSCVSRLVDGLFLEGYTYIPRMIYKNVILSPRSWRFTLDSSGINYTDFVKKFNEWRVKWKLPDIIYEKHFDDLFLINLNDSSQVHNLYLDLIKNSILVFVDYGMKEILVKDCNGKKYYSEFVIPFIKESKGGGQNNSLNTANVLKTTSDYTRNKAVYTFYDKERVVTPGFNDWWYLKFYCDNQSADSYLCDNILPWCENHISQGNMIQFFFIRYADPEFHIRLRIKLSGNLYMDVIEPWIRDMINKTGISNMSINSYERELERYGGSLSYSFVEEYFYWDSLFIMKILKNKMSDEYDEELIVMNNICILSCFDLKIDDQIEFFENSYTELNRLKKEYNQYTKKFIILIDHINELLSLKNAVSEDEKLFNELKSVFEVWKEKLKLYVVNLHKYDNEGKLTNNLVDILRSILHMHCNRFRGDTTWERKTLEYTYRSLYAYRNYKKYNP